MKKIFLNILILLLSSCSNNNNNNNSSNTTTNTNLTINTTDMDWTISMENISDPNDGTIGAFHTRGWLYYCASGRQNKGYFYIANYISHFGEDQFNNNAITFSADKNPTPLRLIKMIYVESNFNINFESIIKSCISDTYVSQPNVYVQTMIQKLNGEIVHEIMGTRIFPNVKSVTLKSGTFNFV